MGALPLVGFKELAPAEELSARLEQAQFHPQIWDSSGDPVVEVLNPHLPAHIKIVLPEEEHAAALAKLGEWHASDGALKDAVLCPDCGSPRVTLTLPSVLLAAAALEHSFYCEACHFTWPVECR